MAAWGHRAPKEGQAGAALAEEVLLSYFSPSDYGRYLLRAYLARLLQLSRWTLSTDSVGFLVRDAAASLMRGPVEGPFYEEEDYIADAPGSAATEEEENIAEATRSAAAGLMVTLMQTCFSNHPWWVDSNAGILFLRHAMAALAA